MLEMSSFSLPCIRRLRGRQYMTGREQRPNLRGRDHQMAGRRTFLKESLALAAMLIAAEQTPPVRAATGDKTKPLRMLILGGTGFIGPYHVRYAVQRGHHVSVFNRGIRRADLPSEVEHLQGDRNGDLKSIMGR